MRPHRSLLFSPANRPAIRDKALGAGADIVCLDLEDAVPPADKASAREAATEFLTDAPGPERVVRINGLRSVEGLRDILALLDAQPTGGNVVQSFKGVNRVDQTILRLFCEGMHGIACTASELFDIFS